jgi:hypothetical protein
MRRECEACSNQGQANLGETAGKRRRLNGFDRGHDRPEFSPLSLETLGDKRIVHALFMLSSFLASLERPIEVKAGF